MRSTHATVSLAVETWTFSEPFTETRTRWCSPCTLVGDIGTSTPSDMQKNARRGDHEDTRRKSRRHQKETVLCLVAGLPKHARHSQPTPTPSAFRPLAVSTERSEDVAKTPKSRGYFYNRNTKERHRSSGGIMPSTRRTVCEDANVDARMRHQTTLLCLVYSRLRESQIEKDGTPSYEETTKTSQTTRACSKFKHVRTLEKTKL